MTHYLLYSYIALNLFSFALFGYDKHRAIRRRYRIPEKSLILSALPGPFGGLFAMFVFRHKIRKPKFYLLVPSIALIHIAAFYLIRTRL